MRETTTIERETLFESLETGEIVETHAEAMELFRAGADIAILTRTRENGGEWSDLIQRLVWEH